jgi:hypothetical protein
MRVIAYHQVDIAEELPTVVASFVPPVAYDTHAFSLHTHGISGRCSYCMEPAETMTPGGAAGQIGKQRWLAFCQEHDRQRRWVRERRSGGWWYLPPPERNERGHWWRLAYSFTGRAEGTAGWYLHRSTGETTIDLCATKLHRARALAELYFALHAPDCSAASVGRVER